jgi:hypothetical protein
MQLHQLMAFALIASSNAWPADSSDRTYPVDSNSACMDRTVDASTGNCVEKTEGTPRHTYPPRPVTTAIAPASGAAPTVTSSPTVRKSAVAR